MNPYSLLELKETGVCEFEIPEILFDMDYSGHYKRRIKTLAVSIPCVVGPDSSLSCTLRLLNHEYRDNKLAKTATDYPKKTDEEDERFVTNPIPITAIAVSQGQNDSGVFELNFKDERFMPFEGAGAISKWRVELPKEFRSFDYDTISDVKLHIRYTANEGGEGLKKAAIENLKSYVKSAEELGKKEGLFRMFDLKHELATDWYRFLHPQAGETQEMKLGSLKDKLPFFTTYHKIENLKANAFIVVSNLSNLKINLEKVEVKVELTTGSKIGELYTYSNIGQEEKLETNENWKLLITKSDANPIKPEELENVYLIMRYQFGFK